MQGAGGEGPLLLQISPALGPGAAGDSFEFPCVPLKSQRVLWMTKDASSDLLNFIVFPPPYVSNRCNLFAELQGFLSFFDQPQVDGGLLKRWRSCFLRAGVWALDCVIRGRETSKEVGSTAGGGL